MDKETKMFFLKELKEHIDALDYEELQEYIADPEINDPEFLEQAKLRLKEIEKDMAIVYNMFLKTLKKCHYNYVVNDEDPNKISFTYNRMRFYADIDCEYDCVTIYYIHNIQINKEDDVEYSLLKRVVNETNKICPVATVYGEDEVTGDITVVSKTTFQLISKNPCFDLELGAFLQDFKMARDFVKSPMKRKYNK